MKKIIITILFLTASTFIYSQSMNLNKNKIRTVDSTMGLGITPTSRLHVFGNGTTSNLLNLVNDKDATKDSSVVIDAIGNVGIGKEAPTAKLYVQDTASSIGGSIPVAYIRAAKPNKIALGAVSISVVNEITPDYNIGLYASSMGGTNNFAGYFNKGDVYIDNNVGIGTKNPVTSLHIKDGSERLGVVTYSTLDSTHLSTQDVKCTDTIQTSGTFYYSNAGATVSINNAYGVKLIGFKAIYKDSMFVELEGITLSDDESYNLIGGLGMPIYGTISVDSAQKKLFIVQFVADGDGAVILGDMVMKRWSSITYVDDDSATDNMFDIYDYGNGCAIKNRLGYTVNVTIDVKAFQ